MARLCLWLRRQASAAASARLMNASLDPSHAETSPTASSRPGPASSSADCGSDRPPGGQPAGLRDAPAPRPPRPASTLQAPHWPLLPASPSPRGACWRACGPNRPPARRLRSRPGAGRPRSGRPSAEGSAIPGSTRPRHARGQGPASGASIRPVRHLPEPAPPVSRPSPGCASGALRWMSLCSPQTPLPPPSGPAALGLSRSSPAILTPSPASRPAPRTRPAACAKAWRAPPAEAPCQALRARAGRPGQGRQASRRGRLAGPARHAASVPRASACV